MLLLPVGVRLSPGPQGLKPTEDLPELPQGDPTPWGSCRWAGPSSLGLQVASCTPTAHRAVSLSQRTLGVQLPLMQPGWTEVCSRRA